MAGSTVAVVRPGGEGVRFFDLDDRGKFRDLAMPGHKVADLVLTADGRRLVTIERPPMGEEPRGNRNAARAMAGDGAGKPPTDLDRVWLWDPRQADAPIGALALPEPKPDPSPARGGAPRMAPPLIAASPDGKTIAVAGFFDSAITLWNAEDGSQTRRDRRRGHGHVPGSRGRRHPGGGAQRRDLAVGRRRRRSPCRA